MRSTLTQTCAFTHKPLDTDTEERGVEERGEEAIKIKNLIIMLAVMGEDEAQVLHDLAATMRGRGRVNFDVAAL